MREAGRFSSERQARTLADFLLTEGIETRVDTDAGRWVLWVYDDEHLDQVRRELERYLAEPEARRYSARGSTAEGIRRADEEARERAQRLQVDVRRRWARYERGLPPVTIALIVACIAVALLTGLDIGNPNARWFLLSLPAVADGQVWRLVTPIFLHGSGLAHSQSLLHILFNLMWLSSLGRPLEARYGSVRFAVLVLILAVVSNLVQALFVGPLFGGMSGVVYGLLGFAWVKSRMDPTAALVVSQQTVFFMLGWLVLGFVIPTWQVANGAHLGGLVAGAAAAGVSRALRRR